eukprot:GHUV01027521.1.p1 GENE.GHUV01027521.1~~GHUV01027521.1.p1  ORF type:complete len:106 (+),score=18.07 GHUV01027521.1:188-505(+)
MSHTNAMTPEDLGPRSKLLVDKHAAYIASFSNIWEGADKLEHVATEHFWMSGMYWGLTAMDLMGRLHEMDTARIVEWVSEASLHLGMLHKAWSKRQFPEKRSAVK